MNRETALITGASSGLGIELAKIFAKNNYNLILNARNLAKLQATVKEIEAYECKVTLIQGDIRDSKTLNTLTKHVSLEKASVLINNAGVLCPGLPLQELSEQTIEEVISVNLLSLINLTKRAYKIFLENKKGTIININSIVGFEPKPFRKAYAASRFGERGFTESLALEAKEKGIGVLGVYQTRIKTNQEYVEGFSPEYVAEGIMDAFKLGLEE